MQFSTLILALLNLLPRGGCLPNILLKRLLIVTAILRFVKIDSETGNFVKIDAKELESLMYIVLVIGAL